MLGDDVRRLMELYPRIFFACHTRHVQDPETRRVVSSHQVSILDHLDEVEPTTLTGLARHMGVTASTTSLSIDRLERGGYVRRRRDSHDARRIGITLTAAGVRIRDAQSVLDADRVRAMLSRIEPGERQQALNGLARLAEAAAAQAGTKRLYGLREGQASKPGVHEEAP